MSILKCAFGHYEAVGNADETDCVIGHSFGTVTGEGSVNRSLADFIAANANTKPVIVDRMLANEIDEAKLAHVVEGDISNSVGQGVGTWGVLVEAKSYMY